MRATIALPILGFVVTALTVSPFALASDHAPAASHAAPAEGHRAAASQGKTAPVVSSHRPKLHPNKPPKKESAEHGKKGSKAAAHKKGKVDKNQHAEAEPKKGWLDSAKDSAKNLTDGVSVSVGHHFDNAKEHGAKLWDFSHTKLGVWFGEVKAKFEALRHLDEHNLDLIRRIAVLESENAKLVYLKAQCEEKDRVTELREKAIEEGGHEGARTLASIETEDPGLLAKPPKALFESALRAFEEGDFETSAKSFTVLSDNEENDHYETAQVLFLAGVSLYKIQNFKLAKKYLDRAEKKATQKNAGANNVSYAPRALAWKALCAKGLGDHSGRKKLIYELIHKYPRSIEARRLNRHA